MSDLSLKKITTCLHKLYATRVIMPLILSYASMHTFRRKYEKKKKHEYAHEEKKERMR
jgi:hypothetical protein